MTRRGLLLGALIGLVCAGVVAWFLHTHERVAREITGPMRGQARYNPFYALERALASQGHAVESHAHLAPVAASLAAGDLLVLGGDVRALSPSQSARLLDWIAGGGHLVFGLPEGAEGRRGELLEALGLDVVAHFDCDSWDDDDEVDDPWSACWSFGFHVEADSEDAFEVLWGDAEEGYRFGRRRLGEGSWTVVADLDFLGNHELDGDYATALAWQTLAPWVGRGKALLVYAADVPPLHVLIVRHGWPLVLPLALALLAWLWSRAPRLGPALPPATAPRRALLEHVVAAGEFAFRRGRAIALHAALRRAVMRRWERHDPALAALEGEALVRALAGRCDRDPAGVRHALFPTDITHAERFLASIRTLMELKP